MDKIELPAEQEIDLEEYLEPSKALADAISLFGLSPIAEIDPITCASSFPLEGRINGYFMACRIKIDLTLSKISR